MLKEKWWKQRKGGGKCKVCITYEYQAYFPLNYIQTYTYLYSFRMYKRPLHETKKFLLSVNNFCVGQTTWKRNQVKYFHDVKSFYNLFDCLFKQCYMTIKAFECNNITVENVTNST